MANIHTYTGFSTRNEERAVSPIFTFSHKSVQVTPAETLAESADYQRKARDAWRDEARKSRDRAAECERTAEECDRAAARFQAAADHLDNLYLEQ